MSSSGSKRRYVMLTLAGLLGSLLLVSYWVVATQSGLRGVLNLGQRLAPDTFSVESVAGRLLGPLRLTKLEFDVASMKGSIDALSANWQVDDGLRISSISLRGVDLSIKSVEDTADNGSEIILPESLRAPFPIELVSADVQDLVIRSNTSDLDISSIEISGRWKDTKIDVSRLLIQAPLFDVSALAELNGHNSYPMSLNAELALRPEGYAEVVTQLKVAGNLDKTQIELNAQSPYSSVVSLNVTELLAPTMKFSYEGASQISYLGQSHQLELSGSGDASSVSVDVLRLNVGDGQIAVNGDVDWSSTLSAQIELLGSRVDPDIYLDNLPGEIDFRALLDLQQASDGEFEVFLNTLDGSGSLFDLPLKASGSGRYAKETIEARDVLLQLGSNQISLNGKLADEAEFDWLLELEKLEQLGKFVSTDLAGSIRGRGRVKGLVDNPVIEARLNGQDLSIEQQAIDLFELELDGEAKEHSYRFTLETPDADIYLAGRGEVSSNPFSSSNLWQYLIQDLELAHRPLDPSRPDYQWSLAAEAGGHVGEALWSVAPLCLKPQPPRQGGAVCLSGSQDKDQDAQASVSIADLDLSQLNALAPDGVRLAGKVSGALNWMGELQTSSGLFSLDGLALSVQSTEGLNQVLEFLPGRIELVPAGSAAEVQFYIDLPLVSNTSAGDAPHGVFVEGRMDVQAGEPLQRWPIAAQLALELPDLSWLAGFAEQIDRVEAALTGALTMSGSIEQPSLAGELNLAAPMVRVDSLGIELNDSHIELAGSQKGISLHGSSVSGDGVLNLAGDLEWTNGLVVDARLQGADFLVSDSSLARAAISPNLDARFEDSRLTLRGDVGLPIAEIQVATVPEGAVSVSPDQQLLESEANAEPLDIDAEVRLILGDKVRFEGLGLKASFGGEVTLSEKSTGATTGRGEIVIKEGTYQAYGQDLSVANGKVLFAGGPIESPGLDIRAVRQATPDVQVGVMVQGSLADPRLDIFSQPTLPQSDQLAYLVLGRPLSSSSASENSVLQQAAMAIGVEGGTLVTEKIGKNLGVDTFGIESAPGTGAAQAALVVGKYLSPRLYVSYGYGLFEPISTLRMEYQLSPLWRVVTQSTNIATGGDVFWVKER